MKQISKSRFPSPEETKGGPAPRREIAKNARFHHLSAEPAPRRAEGPAGRVSHTVWTPGGYREDDIFLGRQLLPCDRYRVTPLYGGIP